MKQLAKLPLYCLAIPILVAALIVAAGKTPGVRAQAPEIVSKWEYKVILFAPHDFDGQTKRLNAMAAAGWEYVGLIHPGQDDGGRGVPLSTVAFRRPESSRDGQ